jgi:hypothetical protein
MRALYFWWNASLCRGIQNILSTPSSKENVAIQYSQERLNGSIEYKVAQVEFFASQIGSRQICLKASDR